MKLSGIFVVATLVFVFLAAGGAASGTTAAAPANDNFANAVVLAGQSASRTNDTNVDATLEAGEATTVAGAIGGGSIWYVWTAPIDGQVRIDTRTSDFDTLLGVYTGAAVGALTEVASNDDCCGALTSRVRFVATAEPRTGSESTASAGAAVSSISSCSRRSRR